MSDPLLRLRRIARPMSLIVTIAMLALPLGLLIASLMGTFDEAYLRAEYRFLTLPATISPVAWIAVFGLGILTLGLVMIALWHMRRLFSLYAMGDVFGPDTSRAIRSIGLTLCALAVFQVLGRSLVVLALTSTNPPGQRSLSIGLGSTDLFLVFTSVLLTAIGWAMTEATRISDENKRFI